MEDEPRLSTAPSSRRTVRTHALDQHLCSEQGDRVWGPIGGPVAPIFAAGIRDVSVRFSSWWRRNTPWAYTSYWREPGNVPGGLSFAALPICLPGGVLREGFEPTTSGFCDRTPTSDRV